jgi:predicted acylesterase/phospholipase RssA
MGVIMPVFSLTMRLLVVPALALSLAACVAARPKEAPAIRTLQPMEAVDTNATSTQVFNVARPAAEDDGVHTVLALSAGGADGAYGAGVLTGWTRNGSRPQFDVVTGVSTGALMAVLAFLGPEYDGMLEQFYTTQTNEKIYTRGSGLLGESLYDNGPLKEQISAFITQDVLDRVAEQHAKGRRLYVATTNLDAGVLVIWDMGEIANGGRSDDVQHFQKVLRASAAVPAYFPPVYIKPQRGIQLRQSHVDGGVKEPVLVKGFMFPEGKGKKELYMIINGNTTRLNASQAVSGKAMDIAKKSIVELMRQLQDDALYRDYVLAQNTDADFYMTQIPDNIPLSEEGLNFNLERMRHLYQAGYQDGLKGPEGWHRDPPGLDRYEKLAKR